MDEKKIYAENTLLVVGTSRTNETNPIMLLYGNLNLVLIINFETGEILSAEANTISRNTNEFIFSLLVGKNLFHDIDEISASIRRRYLGASKRVLINCLKDAKNKVGMALKNL